jgi:hypothetical protein
MENNSHLLYVFHSVPLAFAAVLSFLARIAAPIRVQDHKKRLAIVISDPSRASYTFTSSH